MYPRNIGFFFYNVLVGLKPLIFFWIQKLMLDSSPCDLEGQNLEDQINSFIEI